ncbi:protein phosphatase 1E, putative [Entamoeba invadens IP1]|uniref:Protein phosphatase 1E, putative n=1 Tax=Entamoeba invadens TaxID=33085 RepID=S0B8D7_ENTIV|nr:protein phosphatase 1E, putative [Entamoeba invadens IP1]ELP94165.1 protein phosphatase 1E, putative [Entamoeba invadens IP1]BAN42302.1 protein phosphatase 1E, putative [Entamoeba invadens]|eukprot:XP_004260936.1 protein phosphatase 1E, putative [Entamoeba invadens IP1]
MNSQESEEKSKQAAQPPIAVGPQVGPPRPETSSSTSRVTRGSGRVPPRRGLTKTRGDMMSSFKGILNKTTSDTKGLESIRECDIADRIGYLCYQKCKGKEIPFELLSTFPPVDSTSTSQATTPSKCVKITEVDSKVPEFEMEENTEFHESLILSRDGKIGPKTRMEDYDIIVDDLRCVNKAIDEEMTFIGVFDGHLGTSAAEFCCFKLYNEVIRCKEFPVDVKKSLEIAALRCEEGFKEISEAISVNAGTTVAVAIITQTNIYAMNVGDTEIVLSCTGQPADVLSEKHCCNVEEEKRRIESAGGKVFNFHGWRVEGVLSVSRSIGDEGLKQYVPCLPYVCERKRDGEEEFLVVASDGFWNFINYEETVQIIRKVSLLEEKGVDGWGVKLPENKKEVARYLVDLAIARKSPDNVTVLVAFFK